MARDAACIGDDLFGSRAGYAAGTSATRCCSASGFLGRQADGDLTTLALQERNQRGDLGRAERLHERLGHDAVVALDNVGARIDERLANVFFSGFARRARRRTAADSGQIERTQSFSAKSVAGEGLRLGTLEHRSAQLGQLRARQFPGDVERFGRRRFELRDQRGKACDQGDYGDDEDRNGQCRFHFVLARAGPGSSAPGAETTCASAGGDSTAAFCSPSLPSQKMNPISARNNSTHTEITSAAKPSVGEKASGDVSCTTW